MLSNVEYRISPGYPMHPYLILYSLINIGNNRSFDRNSEKILRVLWEKNKQFLSHAIFL